MFPFELTEHRQATFSVRVPQTIAELPEFLFDTPIRRTALEDYLLRSFCEQADSLRVMMRGVADKVSRECTHAENSAAQCRPSNQRICGVARG